MNKTKKQLDDDILMSRLGIKLIDYAQEMAPKLMRGETIEGITMKHAQYILSYLREYIQKDYGHGS
jgi:hypothetical protein